MSSTLSIEQGAQLCRLFADATRLRLLVLLEQDALTVAELTEVTGLSQSRVSTHLGKLRAAGLVQDRRRGASALYSAPELDPHDQVAPLWASLRASLDEEAIARDRERVAEVVRRRKTAVSWVESVAGQMELHYSPGRTWEATAHALLPLLELGDVLDVAAGDGVLAALLAPQARSVTCVDLSEAVVAAGNRRLAPFANTGYVRGDMHRLPFADARFDTVFLMHGLTYTRRAQEVLSDIRRVMRRGAKAILVTLAAHEHAATVATFDHVNQGFETQQLKDLLAVAGLNPRKLEVSSREHRPPYFRVVTAVASAD